MSHDKSKHTEVRREGIRKHYKMFNNGGVIFAKQAPENAVSQHEELIPANAGIIKRLRVDVHPTKDGNVQIGFSTGVEDFTLDPDRACLFAQTVFELGMKLREARANKQKLR